ncbi:MAG TPA: histidine phosphatase family protein [Nitrospirae bacterium]|nr:phosphoserine phosphatase 1 [bacterium BMS3Bbin05]HDO21514.1 histidine phosphatase family protein [Nitrospirota bacterium]HDO36387.1 histidine phosphatase family protein [Nitrospirota bacterium]HDZ88184.1 histidine phosphatase family protein [Nitrospirota bacterium]
MVTTVYLIRHGQTEGSDENRYKGHIDVPLSDEGMKQVGRLSDHMSGLFNNGSGSSGLSHIYCSDLVRAVRTAEIIGKPFGLMPDIIPQLRERSFGQWEGMTFDEIRETYPGEFDAWVKNPLEFSPVGGESTLEVRGRVMPVFYELVGRHEGGSIALVAHGGINRIVLCDILGIPLLHIFRIEQAFACLNILDFYEETPVLRAMNLTF